MRFRLPSWALLVPLIVGDTISVRPTTNPFDVLRPCVTISAGDITRLNAGATIVRTLPEEDGNVAVFSARRLSADGDRLVAWVRQIDRLKQSKFVDAITRFSDSPAPGDLAWLSLDEADLRSLHECRPGRCQIKLTAREVDTVGREIGAAGDAWRTRMNEVFRRIVLDRVLAYVAGGHRALGSYVDGRSPVPLEAVSASLLKRSPCLTEHFRELTEYLGAYPRQKDATLESFLYWSKERFGAKPIVSATHIVIARGRGARAQDAFVVGKQLFATHYVNGSLNITAVVGSGPTHYLVLLNRTNVDVLRGLLAGLTRIAVERRLKAELSSLMSELARRLESGPPRSGPEEPTDAGR